MGAAQAYDLVVVDRPLAADDTGQAVEVLGLDLDPESGADFTSLALRRPSHETGHVIVDDGTVEAGGEQRAAGADLGGLGGESRIPATHPRRRTDDRLGLESGVQEHLGEVGTRGAVSVLAPRPDSAARRWGEAASRVAAAERTDVSMAGSVGRSTTTVMRSPRVFSALTGRG